MDVFIFINPEFGGFMVWDKSSLTASVLTSDFDEACFVFVEIYIIDGHVHG